ncbi:phosphoribosyltransferase family protein [Planococcus ruber]|uniref:phosphoribosyltransferase family protein n=1 Tax=Planococcus ruber TaxID=2027871 RepID=UPI001FEF9252|nr:phosphoribosyltransferase family protein [Planococcus ruber]MCJ1907946.1 phosphoribosyltransferase family protein [Planococcus ruber]
MKTLNQSMSSTIFDQTNYQLNYKLWENLDLTVTVREAYQGLPAEALFSMGLRVNKKRQFLFVSKLIAKHLAVSPSIALGAGSLLASLLMQKEGLPPIPQSAQLVQMLKSGVPNPSVTKESLRHTAALPEKTVFIGMAETATGLGHSVFQHFENAVYIHTTREQISGLEPSFVFEEEHSHATSHKVYAPEGLLEEAEAIVLVDDEISTGNTLINLITALDEQFPGKKYTSLSILDWRNEDQQKKFSQLAQDLKIDIAVLSLMAGHFELNHGSSPDESPIEQLEGSSPKQPQELAEAEQLPYESSTGQQYIRLTGRFGLSSKEQQAIDSWALETAAKLEQKPKRPLVVGIGENMYLALRFGLALSDDSIVQTTTRSPIFAADQEGYPIREKAGFRLPDADGVDQFIYNLNGLDIDRIYLLAESVSELADWGPLISYLEKKAPVEWISLTAAKRRNSTQ